MRRLSYEDRDLVQGIVVAAVGFALLLGWVLTWGA